MSNKVIQYKKGKAQPFEVRKISVKDVEKSTQLVMPEDIELKPENSFTQNVDNFSDEVLEALTKDPDLSVKEINKDVPAQDELPQGDGPEKTGENGDGAAKGAVKVETPADASKSQPKR